jgi:hypothetical protein
MKARPILRGARPALHLRPGLSHCPAHPDSSESLSVRRARDRWLIHCFAGCQPAEILRAGGLTWSDLFDAPPDARRRPRPRLAGLPDADEYRTHRAAARLRSYRAAFHWADEIREDDQALKTLRRLASRFGDTERAWELLALAADLELGRQLAELEYETAMAGAAAQERQRAAG